MRSILRPGESEPSVQARWSPSPEGRRKRPPLPSSPGVRSTGLGAWPQADLSFLLHTRQAHSQPCKALGTPGDQDRLSPQNYCSPSQTQETGLL